FLTQKSESLSQLLNRKGRGIDLVGDLPGERLQSIQQLVDGLYLGLGIQLPLTLHLLGQLLEEDLSTAGNVRNQRQDPDRRSAQREYAGQFHEVSYELSRHLSGGRGLFGRVDVLDA